MLSLLRKYFEKFGDKACCFEDLKPYVTPEDDTLTQFKSSLESVSSDFVSRLLV